MQGSRYEQALKLGPSECRGEGETARSRIGGETAWPRKSEGKFYVTPIRRKGDGTFAVDDWNGTTRRFKTLEMAIEFAKRVMQRKPLMPLYREDQSVARWKPKAMVRNKR